MEKETTVTLLKLSEDDKQRGREIEELIVTDVCAMHAGHFCHDSNWFS